jgi:hypothetical protein
VLDVQLAGGGEREEAPKPVPLVQKAAPANKSPSSFDDMDDDIPF